GHGFEGILGGYLSQVSLLQLGPAADIPARIELGKPVLGPSQLLVLLEHGRVAPLVEGRLDLGVVPERLPPKPEPVLDGPPLHDRTELIAGLATEILQELPGCPNGVRASVDQLTGSRIEANVADGALSFSRHRGHLKVPGQLVYSRVVELGLV